MSISNVKHFIIQNNKFRQIMQNTCVTNKLGNTLGSHGRNFNDYEKK